MLVVCDTEIAIKKYDSTSYCIKILSVDTGSSVGGAGDKYGTEKEPG